MHAPCVTSSPASRLKPRLLFTPERLDLAVKWRFFRHLIEGNDHDAERVYCWHIEKRTGGREPGSWKQSVHDYLAGCDDLLQSMQRAGFDRRYPVRIGSNGRLKAGAHRTACARALGIKVVVEHVDTPGVAGRWGREWFVDHGVAPADLKRIEADWQLARAKPMVTA